MRKCFRIWIENDNNKQILKVSKLLTCLRHWPLQPFREYYELVSHTIHSGCVHFIHKRGEKDFWKLFISIFIYYQSFCQSTVITLQTYIIGHYNPSVRINDLVCHTTYVVYVNFIHKWQDRTTDFLRYFSCQFLFTLWDFARNLLRRNCRTNTLRILFWCLAWG